MDFSRVIPSDAYVDSLAVQIADASAPVDPAAAATGVVTDLDRHDHRQRPGGQHRHPLGLPDAARAGQGVGQPVDEHGEQERRGQRLRLLAQRRPHRRRRHRARQGRGRQMLRGSRAPLIAGAGVAALVVPVGLLPRAARRWGRSAKPKTSSPRPRGSRAPSSRSSPRSSRRSSPRPRRGRPSRKWNEQIPPTADEPGLLLLVKNAAARSAVTLSNLTPGTPDARRHDRACRRSRWPSRHPGTTSSSRSSSTASRPCPRAAKVVNITLAPGAAEGERPPRPR